MTIIHARASKKLSSAPKKNHGMAYDRQNITECVRYAHDNVCYVKTPSLDHKGMICWCTCHFTLQKLINTFLTVANFVIGWGMAGRQTYMKWMWGEKIRTRNFKYLRKPTMDESEKEFDMSSSFPGLLSFKQSVDIFSCSSILSHWVNLTIGFRWGGTTWHWEKVALMSQQLKPVGYWELPNERVDSVLE